MTQSISIGNLYRMAQEQRQVGFRFPIDLIERLDAYAEQMGKEMPGLKFTRADAVRVLLERGLAEAGLPRCESDEEKEGP